MYKSTFLTKQAAFRMESRLFSVYLHSKLGSPLQTCFGYLIFKLFCIFSLCTQYSIFPKSCQHSVAFFTKIAMFKLLQSTILVTSEFQVFIGKNAVYSMFITLLQHTQRICQYLITNSHICQNPKCYKSPKVSQLKIQILLLQ